MIMNEIVFQELMLIMQIEATSDFFYPPLRLAVAVNRSLSRFNI